MASCEPDREPQTQEDDEDEGMDSARYLGHEKAPSVSMFANTEPSGGFPVCKPWPLAG